ncbi:MAG: tetratricopeptide repeat protein [Microcoleaceae cyanobacterium]
MTSKSPQILTLAEEKASRGLLYQKQGKLEAAISLYQEALILVPNLHFVQYNLGIALHHQGDLPTAYTHYSQAIALKPDHIEAHYNIGVILQQQGLLNSAISSYQKVISLCQVNAKNISIQVQAYSNWGSILVNENRLNEAVEIFQRAIALKPDDATLYNNLGLAFLEAGKVESAILNYRQALAVRPNLIVARHNLGKAFQKQGLHSEAITHFLEVIQQRPENIYVYSDCAFSFLELGKLEAAIPYLQKIISNNPFVESFCKRADSFTESDKLEKAKLACLKFIGSLKSFIPKNKPALAAVKNNLTVTYLSLGNVSFEYGDYSQAEIYYKKALELQSLNGELYLKLGKSLAKQKRFNTAIIIYRMGLAVQPDNYSITQELENVLEKQIKKDKKQKADYGARERRAREGMRTKRGRIKKSIGIPTQATLSLESISNYRHHKKIEVLDENNSKAVFFNSKKPSTSPPNLNEIKCKGLNCEPCLKKIFKQLQPIHIGNGIHTFSSPEIPAAHLAQISTKISTKNSAIELEETPIFVTKLPKGRAWIVPQKNDWMICNAIAIINENNQLLAEVSREYPGQLPGCKKSDIDNHRIFTTEELPPLEQINGTVAVLSGLSANVYFHWMVDILPRIEILRRNGINFEQIDWFLINSTQQKFQQETLRILGIPEDKIIESDRHPYIQAQTLIVPSFSGYLGWLPQWGLEFYRKAFLNKSISPLFQDINQYPEKIYISRNKAKHRKVINEAEVVKLLSKYGFVTVELENLSVGEQIGLFANAKLIVSPHGSGLTNIIFCTPGSTVIELVSPNYIRHYYWVISQQLGLKHYYLTGEEFSYYPIRQLMYPNPLTEDILINLNSLEKILAQTSIMKIDFQPKLNFYSGEETSQEILLFRKKFSKPKVKALDFPQKEKEDRINRTAVSSKMPSKVNPVEVAANFHQKALSYLEQKKFESAKTACEQALKNQPDFAEACKTMGRIVQAQGQDVIAFEWYSRAINIQPNFAEAYVNIGTLYAKKQQWQEAINYYEKAVSIKPDLIPAHRNLAKAYQKVGKPAEAANSQYQAYSLEPTKITEIEHINFGNTFLQQEKLTEAISCYRNAVKLNPNSVVAYQNLAAVLSKKGDFEEANTCYQKAIQLEVTNLPKNINHNLVEKSLNISENKKISAQEVSILAKHQIEAKQKVELLEKNISQTTKQQLINKNHHHQNISLTQDAVEAYNRLAQILQNQGQAAEAWQWYKKALSLAPNNSEIYKNLGSLYGQQQQWQEAIKCYQKAEKIQPNSADIYRHLATALTHIDRQTEAAEYWEKAYSLEPETATAEEHLILGNTLLQMNLVERAISSYCNAIKINPNLTAAYQNLGEAIQLNSNSQSSYLEAATHINNYQNFRHSNLQPLKTDELYNLTASQPCHLETATQINNYQNFRHSNLQPVKTDELHNLTTNNSQENQPKLQSQSATNTSIFQASLKLLNRILRQLVSKVVAGLNQNTDLSEISGESSIHLPKNQAVNNHLQENLSYPAKPEFQIQEIGESNFDEISNSAEPSLKNTYWNWQKKELPKNIDRELENTKKTFQKEQNLAAPEIEKIQKLSPAEKRENSHKTQKQKNVAQELEITKETFLQKPNFTTPQINPNPKLSPAEKRENSHKIGVDKNSKSVNTAKVIALQDVYIQRATAYNKQGLYQQAIAECQQAIAVKPDMALAYKILGNIQQKMGSASQRQEAKQNYQKAISLDNQDATVYANLGSLYAEEKLWQRAIPYYQKAIALKPDFAGAYRNLAKAWSQVGKLAEAADCWYQAYTLDPQNITPDQHLNLGNTLSRQGQLTKAISCYQRAIKLNPNYPAAYHNLASTLKRQGKLDEAAIYEQKVRAISANSVKVETNGSKPQNINPEDVLQSSTDKKEKQNLPQISQISQADLIKQAEANLVNSKFYEAISTCQEIILIKPDAIAYQIMGKAWEEINNIEEAIAAYQNCLEVKPNFAEVYVSLGNLYFQQQQQEEAILADQKAIKLAPDLKDSYRGLVEIWLEQGKVEELSYNALIQHPNWATPQEFCTLGKGLVVEGKTEQGKTCFHQAIKLDPKLWEAHYSLGEIFSSQQQWDEAIKYYRQAVELNSESIESYYGLGKALTETEEWQEATGCYQQVIKLEANQNKESSPESEENIHNIDIAEVYHLLGDALQEIGQLDESVAAYHRAIELTGNSPN